MVGKKNRERIAANYNIVRLIFEIYGKRTKRGFQIDPDIVNTASLFELKENNGYFRYWVSKIDKFPGIDGSARLSVYFDCLEKSQKMEPKPTLGEIITQPSKIVRMTRIKGKLRVFTDSREDKFLFHKKQCESCGRVFATLYGQQKYCYPGCVKEQEKREQEKICPICGETYSGRAGKLTCSQYRCRKAYWRKSKGI